MVTTINPQPEPKPTVTERLAPLRHNWLGVALVVAGALAAIAPIPFGSLAVAAIITVALSVARLQAGESVALARLRQPPPKPIIVPVSPSAAQDGSPLHLA
jgi:hypothetical protein